MLFEDETNDFYQLTCVSYKSPKKKANNPDIPIKFKRVVISFWAAHFTFQNDRVDQKSRFALPMSKSSRAWSNDANNFSKLMS